MRNTIHFKPGVELTFNSVVDVRAKLYKALMEEKSGTFHLDLSEVKHCDSAGMALLIGEAYSEKLIPDHGERPG